MRHGRIFGVSRLPSFRCTGRALARAWLGREMKLGSAWQASIGVFCPPMGLKKRGAETDETQATCYTESTAHALQIVAPILHHPLSLRKKFGLVIRATHAISLDVGQLPFNRQWGESLFVRPCAKRTSSAVCPEQTFLIESSTD
ncbi:hypothetical protein P3T23_003628 [Paraburkholderia sp. GAS448]